MNRLVVLMAILLGTSGLFAQKDIPKLHKCQLWGVLPDERTKLYFFMGFTNGLFKGSTLPPCNDIYQSLVVCVATEKELEANQAVAMIDKFYQEHPEKWNMQIAEAIVEALTVRGGPCSGKAPTK
jgi:hypothetical protein